MRTVAGVLAVAVGALVAGPGVERQAAGEQTRGVVHRAAPRIPGAGAELHVSAAGRAGERQRLEVDGAPVRRRAVAAGAHAALDLHRLQVAGEVGQVREVEDLVLRIVERDAVEGEIETRLVDAAQADVAVAGVPALFGVGGERGGVGQQQRGLLAEGAVLELGPRHDVRRDRRRVPGAQRRDRHPLQRLRGRHEIDHEAGVGGDVQFARRVARAREAQMGGERGVERESSVGTRGGHGAAGSGLHPDAGERRVRAGVANGAGYARGRDEHGEEGDGRHAAALQAVGRVRGHAWRREDANRLFMADSLRRYEPVQVPRV